MNDQTKLPLMGAAGIFSMRNNGFNNTASAIAELVDNSIQANASEIQIILINDKRHGSNHVNNIIVHDNGVGMDHDTFHHALIFASGNYIGSKAGLGKYGMGLPNSSVSQTKRFEVYTWQTKNKHRSIHHNYMDLDEIKESNNPYLNLPTTKANFSDLSFSSLLNLDDQESGTIVVWNKPDRLSWKTANALTRHLNQLLGRIFRHYLVGFEENGKKCRVKIGVKVYEYNGQEYDEVRSVSTNITPFDPLFLMTNTQTKSVFPDKKFNGKTFSEFAVIDYPTPANEEGEVHPIRLVFSKLSKDVRDLFPGDPGKGEFGKWHLYRNLGPSKPYANVSIVRAHREIDAGNYGFLRDVSDHTARFWSVEIQIEACHDEIFGVDNSKQSAKIFRNSTKEEDNYDELDYASRIIRDLSIFITNNVKEMKSELEDDARGKRKPGPKQPGEIPVVPEPVPGTGDEDRDKEVTEEEHARSTAWLITRYPELEANKDLLKRTIDYMLSLPCQHYIVYSNLGDLELYSFNTLGDKTIIEINTQHSFYKQFLEKIEEQNNIEALNIMRFLFSSLVQTEKRYIGTDKEGTMRNVRGQMAFMLDELIDKWKHK